MDKVLERHKVPKFTQEEIDDPSIPIAIKKLNLELEKKTPKKKSSRNRQPYWQILPTLKG